MFDHAERRRRLFEVMRAEGVDLLFVGLSSDLEYLSGVERGIPFFGQSSYPHGWVAGGFFRPDADPVFVLPRMVVVFDLPVRPEGDIVVVDEADDGSAIFERVARGLGARGTVAVGDRVWAETTLELGRIFGLDRLQTGSSLVNRLRRVKTADELEAMRRACRTVEHAMAAVAPQVQPGVSMAELREEVEAQLRVAGSLTPSFATHIFTGMDPDSLDSGAPTARDPLSDGTPVLFDFGGVVDGYCSDFGRTIVAGEPPDGFVAAYEAMLAAFEAGRTACRPGALAREVNAACREPIEASGLGEHFRHRMGHGIGLDVHERPFLSPEDETPLEAGMTFTDEPSIVVHGSFGLRIENVVVCAEGGARVLNEYPNDLVTNG
ncbi:Xaa-Pro peptidase family protein [Gaiella sp.]|uniref:M24 family metallopeptidase n=1 Tax=Gaiella sp. TaxID=2663207 RepID=UPI002BF56415|nr:Xaa-Pro peptidase family protein [Gaiella sp.]HWO80551.1 Xaa-Pro peptidase family protein [Gaiella sp.]